jgi:hypothetical protein
MENEFDEVMRKRTDADLIKIINGPPDDYQPVALEAAKREFDRRSLSETQIAAVKEDIVHEQAVDEAKANAPLSVAPKIFAFILPGILLFMIAGTFKADGYDRKAKELGRWTLYGFVFYFGIIVLLNVLERIF